MSYQCLLIDYFNDSGMGVRHRRHSRKISGTLVKPYFDVVELILD